MAERFRYTFEGPPFHFIVDRLFDTEEFVADICSVLELPDTQTQAIEERLVAETFVDEDKFRSILSDVGVDRPSSVINTVFYLAMQSRNSGLDKAQAGKILRESAREKFEGREEQLGSLFERLCLNPLAFDLQKKAERIAVATGQEPERLQIVCDMRPVFDQNHTKIVGVFPRFTLRIDYESAGETGSLDLRLSDKDLDRLISETTKAEKKRDVVRAQLERFDLDVPNVGDR